MNFHSKFHVQIGYIAFTIMKPDKCFPNSSDYKSSGIQVFFPVSHFKIQNLLWSSLEIDIFIK